MVIPIKTSLGIITSTGMATLQLKPLTAQSIWSEILLRRNLNDFFPLKYVILSFGKILKN